MSDLKEDIAVRLSVEDREEVLQVAGELVAVHVYRELQRINRWTQVAGCAIVGNCSNGSCNIVGNCSSSSTERLRQLMT